MLQSRHSRGKGKRILGCELVQGQLEIDETLYQTTKVNKCLGVDLLWGVGGRLAGGVKSGSEEQNCF